MLKTNTAERTETKKALSVAGNGAAAQGLGNLAETVYCPTHGTVKTVWGQCEECVDEGYRDWDADARCQELNARLGGH
jgi:hypothetical protein